MNTISAWKVGQRYTIKCDFVESQSSTVDMIFKKTDMADGQIYDELFDDRAFKVIRLNDNGDVAEVQLNNGLHITPVYIANNTEWKVDHVLRKESRGFFKEIHGIEPELKIPETIGIDGDTYHRVDMNHPYFTDPHYQGEPPNTINIKPDAFKELVNVAGGLWNIVLVPNDAGKAVGVPDFLIPVEDDNRSLVMGEIKAVKASTRVKIEERIKSIDKERETLVDSLRAF